MEQQHRVSTDAEVVRKGGHAFEDRFRRVHEQYWQHVRTMFETHAGEVDKDLAILRQMTGELLDEYAILVTKRLEGTLVSTEEALPLSPQDLAQLIPALANRLRAAKENQRRKGKDRSVDIAYTERLLGLAEHMLSAYGPPQPDDVLWPVVKRRA